MGVLTVQEIIDLWAQGKIDVEHIMGQVLQYLQALQDEIKSLKQKIAKLERQLAELRAG